MPSEDWLLVFLLKHFTLLQILQVFNCAINVFAKMCPKGKKAVSSFFLSLTILSFSLVLQGLVMAFTCGTGL